MRHIHEMNIRRLDFRLLELFETIRASRSVSGAALLLEIPQPTASRGLARLREALGDDLFVRTANGMELTTRGLEAAAIVERILALASQLEVEAKPFDPRSSDREYVIAGSDVGQWVVSAPFYRLARDFPGIRLRTMAVPGGDLAHVLENGDVDLAIGPYPALAGNIREQTLYYEDYRCFCRPDHPFARNPCVETYLGSDHLLALGRATAHAHRETEAILRKHLLPHRIRVTGESYFVGLATLMETDLILTAPYVGLGRVPQCFGLTSLPPPISMPRYAIKQYWHSRSNDDAAHKWLRSTIYRGLAGLGKHGDPVSDRS